jgi:hypothetical protein
MTSKRIEDNISEYLKTRALNTVFIEQLFTSIVKVGELGAHFANVSLGVAFEKSYMKDQREMSAAEDVFTEFVRFKVGELLRDKAPKTIFLVATGNEGAWIDGISRVAFPVGIRSPRLEVIAKENHLAETPNNLVENLIPVVSVSSEGTLTQFANQFVIPKEEALGSTGEEILAPTPSRSNKGTSEILGKLYGSTFTWMSRMVHLVLSDSITDLKGPGKTREERESEFTNTEMLRNLFQELKNLELDMLHLGYPVDRQALSGTSMATPSATGKSAELVIGMMDKMGANSTDLFAKPGLLMNEVMREIFTIAKDPKFRFLTKIKIYTEGLKKWPQSQAARDLKKSLNRDLLAAKLTEQSLRKVRECRAVLMAN